MIMIIRTKVSKALAIFKKLCILYKSITLANARLFLNPFYYERLMIVCCIVDLPNAYQSISDRRTKWSVILPLLVIINHLKLVSKNRSFHSIYLILENERRINTYQ